MTDQLLFLVPVIVAGIAVPTINGVKKLVNSKNPQINLGITFGVCLIMALIALAVTGAFNGVPVTANSIVTWLSLILTVATLIYKNLPFNLPQ